MKPVLIIYLNIDYVSIEYVERYSESVSKIFENLKDDYLYLILPVRNQPTKVECVNPIIVPSEFYEKYKFELKVQMICKLKKIMGIKNEQNENPN